MCTKFQVDWTSTSSKTTLTKNFNLKQDERMDGRTDGRTNDFRNVKKIVVRRVVVGVPMRQLFIEVTICKK